MRKFEVGETVYADITAHAARRCVVVSRKRLTYLLKTLDRLKDDDTLLIKRSYRELWHIPKPELLATPPKHNPTNIVDKTKEKEV